MSLTFDPDTVTLPAGHFIGSRLIAAPAVIDMHRPSDGKAYAGFVVSERAKSVIIRETTGVQRELKLVDIESRTIQKVSMMPEGLANNLTPEQLADLIAYLQSLSSGAK